MDDLIVRIKAAGMEINAEVEPITVTATLKQMADFGQGCQADVFSDNIKPVCSGNRACVKAQ